MTLIELIGVLAIIAVLAALLIPSAIRFLDRVASEKETATLTSLGDALSTGIIRTRQVPAAANWASFIAAEAGMDAGAVTQNLRRQQRAFLHHPTSWFATTTLPYYQTNNSPPGLTAPPADARALIVSSLGAALPALDNNDFDALWNNADMSLPAAAPWTTWSGRADDVQIQRVNLAPLFVNLVLSTYTTGTNLGLYKIDDYPQFYTAPASNGVSRFFLKGTMVNLYASAPSIELQHSVLLEDNTSFVYENGIWRRSITGGAATGSGDVSGIVEAFLKAPANINAANTVPEKIQQLIIVTNFIAFMSNYNRWEDGNFTDNALKDYLDNTLHGQMMDAVEGLFDGAHYPTNDYEPCVPTLQP